jgi:predicted nucleic acid-binding protein
MSDRYVLDCSVTMAWFFGDEATPAIDELLDRLIAGTRAVVARHWSLEVSNTLLMAERRKRCSAADAAHFIGLLESLPVDVDPETGSHSMAGTLALARGYGLTSYDAAYLELAMRANLPLATLDKELRAAAKKAGVKCLPERV